MGREREREREDDSWHDTGSAQLRTASECRYCKYKSRGESTHMRHRAHSQLSLHHFACVLCKEGAAPWRKVRWDTLQYKGALATRSNYWFRHTFTWPALGCLQLHLGSALRIQNTNKYMYSTNKHLNILYVKGTVIECITRACIHIHHVHPPAPVPLSALT